MGGGIHIPGGGGGGIPGPLGAGGGRKFKIPIRLDFTEEEIRAMVLGIGRIKEAVDALTESVSRCRTEVQGLTGDVRNLRAQEHHLKDTAKETGDAVRSAGGTPG